MWSAQLVRREVLEFFLGSTRTVEGRVRQTPKVDIGAGSEVVFLWSADPLEAFTLPSLVIVPDGDVPDLLNAIAAAPQAPSPITSLSRILTREEARQQFEGDAPAADQKFLSVIASLAMVEAVMHSDGRLAIRQLTPMICKRTLAYAWGRALAAKSGSDALGQLPSRWLETYSMLNVRSMSDFARRNVEILVGVLSLITRLANFIRPDTAGGALAFELVHGSRNEQEDAWRRLARRLDRPVGIEALQAQAREERGAYLQHALRLLSSFANSGGPEYDDMVAACAFLATRLAPGSLEHFEVLRSSAGPELLAWYAMYATLQSPREILSLQGGLGFRALRDIRRSEEKLSTPTADVAFSELNVIGKMGVDSIASKLGHASELQVELVPYVTSVFTFQPRNRSRWNEAQNSLDLGPMPEAHLSPRARISQLAAELAIAAREIPELPPDYSSSSKKARRK